MIDQTLLTTIEGRLGELEHGSAQGISARAAKLLILAADLRQFVEAGGDEGYSQAEFIQARVATLTRDVAEQLSREATAFVVRNPRLPDTYDTDLFEREIVEHRRKIDLLVQLSPELQSEPDVVRTDVQLKMLAERLGTARELSSLRQGLQANWSTASNLDKTYPADAVRIAKEARDQAVAFVERRVAQTSDEINQAYSLRREAEDFYDDLRRRHEIPVTKQSGGELVEMVIYFIDLAATKPQAQVTYFESADARAQPRSMAVGDARQIAQQRLLRQVWEPKVDEYVKSARAMLEENKPREALAALEAWRDLPGLGNERLNMSLGGNLETLINQTRIAIEPELERLRKAEALIREAQSSIDPVKGQQLLVQAQGVYSFAPGIADVQRRLLAHANEQFRALMEELGRVLASEDLDIAERYFAEARGLMEAFPRGLDASAQERFSRVRRVLEDVRPLLSRAQLAPADELSQLYTLRDDYEDTYWPGWKRLQRRLATLAARGNLHELRQRIQQACVSETSPAVLERLDAEVAELLKYPPTGLGKGDLQEIRSSQRRVAAWLGFARARDEIARLGRSENGPADRQLVDTPDLQVVRTGLEQAQQDIEAAQAARSQRIAERLESMLRQDEEAAAALKRIRRDVYERELSPQAAERLRAEVQRWLGEATSYRRELRELRRQLATLILDGITAEAEELIAAARASHYRDLNLALIARWLTSAKRLDLPIDELLDLVKLPQRIAGIYTLERDVRSRSDWENVCTEWLAAATIAREHDDQRLSEFCASRADAARRQSVLSEIQALRHDGSPASEQRLEALARDPAFNDDYQVWREYGSFLLRRLKQEIRQAEGSRADVALVERARAALERAHSLALASELHEGPSLSALLDDVRSWEQFAIALNLLARKLAADDGRISAADAAEAERAYSQRRAVVRDNEQIQLLEQAWNRRTRATRPLLERQERSSDLFAQLDALLSLMTLFPDEMQWPPRLRNKLMAAIRQFKLDVNETCDDPGAAKFLRRNAAAGAAALGDSQVLDAQRAELERLAERLEVVRLALSLLPPDAAGLSDVREIRLDDEQQWIERDLAAIQEASGAIDQALRAAANALMTPEHFQRALFMLRQPSQAAFQLAQVPDMFKDRGHPTYQAALLQVRALRQRRERQQHLKNSVELILRKYANVAVLNQLPPPEAIEQLDERTLVAELRDGIARHGRPFFPLEVALRCLNQLAQEEPDDACGLHDTISYDDLDEPGRSYRGLSVVRAVLGRKVAQIHAFYDLLEQVNTLPHDGDLHCPGIVDWTTEKERLLELYEANPEIYRQAYRATQTVRTGDAEGLCEVGMPAVPRWSLQKTVQALGRQEALNYLNRRLLAAGLETTGGATLCAVARHYDQMREQRVQALQADTQDTMRFESVLSSRWNSLDYVRDRFMQSYNRIANQRPGRVNTRDAADYFNFADELYKLFPRWPDFLQKVEHIAKLHPTLTPRWLKR